MSGQILPKQSFDIANVIINNTNYGEEKVPKQHKKAFVIFIKN